MEAVSHETHPPGTPLSEPLPEPLTTPDIDLRDFSYMPFEVVRLRDSDFVVESNGEEFRAGVLLWCAAWHQVPAASLPNDDRFLANLAGFGRDLEGWLRVKEVALHKFVLCSDGRLYHPVVAEKAIEAMSKRRGHKQQTAAATEARRQKKEARNDNRDDQRDDKRNVKRRERRNVVEGKGREGNRSEGNRSSASSSPTDVGLERAESARASDVADWKQWKLADAARAALHAKGWSDAQIAAEVVKYVLHWREHGIERADPDAGFERWMLRAAKEHRLTPPSDPAAPPAPKAQFVQIRVGEPSWNAWRAHYADTGKNAHLSQMREAEAVDKPFSVPSLWPPGMAAEPQESAA
jgi:hypothetical protein